MVLEALLNPKKAERRPWEMFFIGLAYSTIALFMSLWVFSTHISINLVVLTTFAALPIVYGAIKLEEKKDKKIQSEKILLKEHSKALSFFMFLFLGCTVAFSVWYLVLPEETAAKAFSTQVSTITAINSGISGKAVSEETGLISKIFANNLKVLFFCLIFSFFYGFGAIYILIWNASVIGTAIGIFAKTSGYAFALGRYLTHGIPEILAYFTVGLAGGIISIAVIRHDFMGKKFKHILFDSIDLTLLAIGILFIAALIEVYVTPTLF